MFPVWFINKPSRSAVRYTLLNLSTTSRSHRDPFSIHFLPIAAAATTSKPIC